jgi:hypothetical protein
LLFDIEHYSFRRRTEQHGHDTVAAGQAPDLASVAVDVHVNLR